MSSSRPRILMCPPDHYGIFYEINPWMNTARKADHEDAVRQWNDLRDVLQSLGAETCLQEPVEGLPDLVFTANAGMVHGDELVLSRFRHEQRQGEEDHDARWFSASGVTVVRLPEAHYFEGAGDALFCGDTLLAGYRLRSDVKSHHWIADRYGCRVIPVELTDPYYYHLDTCFCPLTPELAVWYPPAFDTYGQQALRETVGTLIEVAEEEARSFACNAVVVGGSVVTNTSCPRLHRMLRAEGFEPIATPLSEFVKAGGSAKCLTLRLDGEDAAAWRHAVKTASP